MAVKHLPIQMIQTCPNEPLTVSFVPLALDPETILNISVPVADTEQAVVIPVGSAKCMMKLLTGKLYYATVTGGPYFTVGAGTAITLEVNPATGITLYIKSSKASDTLELRLQAYA